MQQNSGKTIITIKSTLLESYKSDNREGDLNTISVRGAGNLNDPVFKSSDARGSPGSGAGGRGGGGGGMFKVRIYRRISLCQQLQYREKNSSKQV